MKKTYYHISDQITKDIEKFIPRIPQTVLPNEDHIINRVCVCKNIIDCFNCVCYIDNYLKDAILNHSDYKKMRVYEFIIDDNEVLSPENISNYVPDAIHNKEFWVTHSLKPTNSYVITPSYFQVQNTPVGIKFSYLEFDIVSDQFIEELKKKEYEQYNEKKKQKAEFANKFGKDNEYTDSIINMWKDILNN